jgi:hypothetical protein
MDLDPDPQDPPVTKQTSTILNFVQYDPLILTHVIFDGSYVVIPIGISLSVRVCVCVCISLSVCVCVCIRFQSYFHSYNDTFSISLELHY